MISRMLSFRAEQNRTTRASSKAEVTWFELDIRITMALKLPIIHDG